MAAAVPSVLSDEDIVALSAVSAFRFDREGRRTRSLHLIYLIQNELESPIASQVREVWNTAFEDRPRLRVRTVAPDGKERWLDPATLVEGPGGMSVPGVISELRVLAGPIPAAERGSVVEILVEAGDKKPVFPAGMIYRVPWLETPFGVRGKAPALYVEKRVIFPEELSVQTALQRVEGATRAEQLEGGEHTIRFVSQWEDAEAEKQLKARRLTLSMPLLMISTGSSWQSVAAAYEDAVEQAIQGSNLADVVKGLGAEGSAEEKIAAVVAYLRREMRYTSVALGAGTVLPRGPQEVIAQKYGDCKDLSTLMVAMLRELGVEANVALVSTSRAVDPNPEMPGLGFPHAIVHIPGSKPRWIDPTSILNGALDTPAVLQGRPALIARRRETQLVRIPLSSAEDNQLIVLRALHFDDARKNRIVEEIRASGVHEIEFRSLLSHARPGGPDAERWTRLRALGTPGAIALLPDPREGKSPLTVRAEGKKSRLVRNQGDGAVEVELRWEDAFAAIGHQLPHVYLNGGKENGAVGEADLSEAEKLELPEFLPMGAELVYQITVPPGYVPDPMPKPVDEDFAGLTWRVSFEQVRPEQVVVRATLSVPEGNVERPLRGVAEWCGRMQEASRLRFRDGALKLISERKAKEGFTALQAADASGENSSAHQLRWARALLLVGLGTEAQRRAERAVELAPEEFAVLRDAAWIFQHNGLGMLFGRGWAKPKALETYERLVRMTEESDEVALQEGEDPKWLRRNILGLYAQAHLIGANGVWFDPGETLEKGFAALDKANAMAPKERVSELTVASWLERGRYEEVLRAHKDGRIDKASVPYVIAAKGLLSTPEEALRLAEEAGARDTQSLIRGSYVMMDRGKFNEAAELLERVDDPDPRRAAALRQQAVFLRQMARPEPADVSGARAMTRQVLLCLAGDEPRPCLTKLLHPEVPWELFGSPEVDDIHASLRGALSSPERITRSRRFAFELMWVTGALPEDRTSDGTTRVVFQTRAFPLGPVGILFLPHNGELKLAAVGTAWPAAGKRALSLLERDEKQAARDLLELAMGRMADPPGNGFFETRIEETLLRLPESEAPGALRATAYTLLNTPSTAEQGLTGLEGLLQEAATGPFRTAVLWGLTRGYLYGAEGDVRKNAERAARYAVQLLAAVPDETTAYHSSALAAQVLGDTGAVGTFIERLESNAKIQPRVKLWVLASMAMKMGAYARAVKYQEASEKEAGPMSRTLNGVAWAKLLQGEDLETAKRLALQATTGDFSGASHHTLACLQGITGEGVDAAISLQETHFRRNLNATDASILFAHAMIAEGAGLKALAIDLYGKIGEGRTAAKYASDEYRGARNRRQRLLSDAMAASR